MSQPPVNIQATDMYYITMFHQAIIQFGEGKSGNLETIYKECMKKVPKDKFMRGLMNHLASENTLSADVPSADTTKNVLIETPTIPSDI